MEFGCVMAGGSEQQLLRYFRESASSILQLSEVQQWWRQGGGKGKEEEVQVRASDILSCSCPSLAPSLCLFLPAGVAPTAGGERGSGVQSADCWRLPVHRVLAEETAWYIC